MRLSYPADSSSASLRNVMETTTDNVFYLADPRVRIEPGQRMFERMKQVLSDSGAGLVYADAVGHPHLDYQLGSIRDNFDFGPVVAISISAARQLELDDCGWGGRGTGI